MRCRFLASANHVAAASTSATTSRVGSGSSCTSAPPVIVLIEVPDQGSNVSHSRTRSVSCPGAPPGFAAMPSMRTGSPMRAAHGERDAGDAADPIRILHHDHRRQAAGGNGHRRRVELAWRVVGAPEKAHVGALGEAFAFPRDDRILHGPEIGVGGHERQARCVDGGDDERVAIERARAPRQREIPRGKGPGARVGKPRSGHAHATYIARHPASMQRERAQARNERSLGAGARGKAGAISGRCGSRGYAKVSASGCAGRTTTTSCRCSRGRIVSAARDRCRRAGR